MMDERGERHVYFTTQYTDASLESDSVQLAPGEEPWRAIGHPAKYLGKLFIDRRNGERPERSMIIRALKIISGQAPKKNSRVSVQFKSSSRITNPPTLIGSDEVGTLLIRVPLLKIFSVGCSSKFFYYLTAAPYSEEATRFWLFAYSCKTREAAHNLSTNLISMCSLVRELRQDMLEQSRSRLTTSTPQSSLGSAYQWSPNSVLSAGSGGSSTNTTPSKESPPQHIDTTYRARIGKLVDEAKLEKEPKVMMQKSIAGSPVRARHPKQQMFPPSRTFVKGPSPELMYDYSIDGMDGMANDLKAQHKMLMSPQSAKRQPYNSSTV